MWLVSAVVAIALSGTVFMIRFLVALLCDAAASASCRILAVDVALRSAVSEIRTEGRDYLPAGIVARRKSDEYIELSENQLHAKECVSGLMVLALHHAGGDSLRSIRVDRIVVSQQCS
jgi:hypothetical protein